MNTITRKELYEYLKWIEFHSAKCLNAMPTIKVEVCAGASIENSFEQAVRLANTLGVCIEFTFNAVTCCATPNGDTHEGVKEYHKAASKGEIGYKYAKTPRTKPTYSDVAQEAIKREWEIVEDWDDYYTIIAKDLVHDTAIQKDVPFVVCSVESSVIANYIVKKHNENLNIEF